MLLLMLAGCGDAPADAVNPDRAPFDKLVESRRACQQDDDCTIVGNGCAALCGVSVNKAFSKEVQAAAANLNGQYAATGLVCHGLCSDEVGVCEAGRCGIRAK